MQIVEAVETDFGVRYTIYNIYCVDGRRVLAVSDNYIVWNE